MQKVYLLLRSNKQTGPYSLEELLQLNLKPFDLVWVEGRSAAWQYPSEIPSLQPHVPETPHADAPFKPIATAVMEEKFAQTSNSNSWAPPQNPVPQKAGSPKRVFVSIPTTPGSSNEQKAFANQNSYGNHQAYMPPAGEPVFDKKIEVRQDIPTYSQNSSSKNQQKVVADEEVQTHYSRPLHEVEEDYTNWVYQQKTKKKSSVNPKDLVLAALILAVIVGGYYVMSKPSVANSILAANKLATPTAQQPGEINPAPVQTKEETPADEKNLVASGQMTVANTAYIASNEGAVKPLKNSKSKNPSVLSKTSKERALTLPSSKNSMPAEKTNSNIHNKDNDNHNEVVLKEPEVKQQPKENTATVEKKKKFGDVLRDLFSKKNKNEQPKNNDVVLEDPKHADNRQSTKREAGDNASDNSAGSSEVNTPALMEQVDLSSNAPDSWMMGVKNLKITLRNRSNLTIQTASVLVNYYNENNDLIEKKLVYFNNIAPRSKLTVAAPDSKFADHVDFKLSTISAKEDRYAKY